MNIWHDIDKSRINKDDFMAYIEISKHSKNKYELDKETGLIMLDRVLSTSMIYPESYGFIPLTLAEDNDPLDVLVICQEPIQSAALVRCTPIGVLKMVDSGEGDSKIIAVATKDSQMNFFKDIKELPTHMLDEMANFFENYKALEGKYTEILGYESREVAEQIIVECIDRYYQTYGDRKKKK